MKYLGVKDMTTYSQVFEEEYIHHVCVRTGIYTNTHAQREGTNKANRE